jgi:hypothetical protein
MKSNRAPDYGIDAPRAVRNLLIVAALGVISLITRLLGLWSRQDLIAVIARPLIAAGLSCGAMGSWMIYDSKIGKVREREQYLMVLGGVTTRADVSAVSDCSTAASTLDSARSGSTNGSKRISAATTPRGPSTSEDRRRGRQGRGAHR